MARTRGASFDQQRAAIIEAAARLFAARSFAGTSTAQIAAAAGVSKPLLYHYYRDKEALLFDIADGYMDRLLALVAAASSQGLAPEAHFRALLRAFMAEYRTSQDKHMVLVQDVKFLSSERHAAVVAKQRAVVDAVAAAIGRLKPRFTRRALRVPLARILVGMINWTFTWLRPDGPLAYEDMAEVVTELFLTGVLPAPLVQAAPRPRAKAAAPAPAGRSAERRLAK
ncbi:MAG: TetR/AcrR family transcriptional regulator [Betaproteobacteria bacterium]